MYDNIMIPVSLDQDRDLTAALKAAKLLASEGARITFAHVLETIPSYVLDVIPEDTFTARREMAEKLLEKSKKGVDNAHGVILEGTAGRTLTNWAKENRVDCIVIASHRPVMSDIILGSTASWVVRHANCAVHVVR